MQYQTALCGAAPLGPAALVQKWPLSALLEEIDEITRRSIEAVAKQGSAHVAASCETYAQSFQNLKVAL